MSIAVIILLAALLPFVAAVTAKAGGSQFDNNDPREWLDHQKGWRARANAAQANSFEALPLFYAALLYAFFSEAPIASIKLYAMLWLLLRLSYILAYIKGKGSIRSFLWGGAFVVNLLLLFA